MTLRITTLLVLLVSLQACKNKEEKPAETIVEKVAPVPTIATYQNDSLNIDFKNNLSVIIDSLAFNTKKELAENKNDPGVLDTILTRTYDNSMVKSRVSTNGEHICNAQIKSEDINSKELFSTAINKASLEQLIGDKITSDSIKIENSTQTAALRFYFENDTIGEIIFDSNME